jgi:glutathione S-transferase
VELVAFVIACALIEYMIFGFAVGKARSVHNVNAPSIAGPPEFERTMRAHQNTLENLVIFIPAINLFAVYVHAEIAAALGAVWIIGRFLYFRGYVEDAPKRAPGMMISWICSAIMLVGGAIGALMAWL